MINIILLDVFFFKRISHANNFFKYNITILIYVEIYSFQKLNKPIIHKNI